MIPHHLAGVGEWGGMLGKARSGCMKFCSISGILLGQFSAGRLEHSLKPFGKGRGPALETLWSGQPALFFSILSCPCQALTLQFSIPQSGLSSASAHHPVCLTHLMPHVSFGRSLPAFGLRTWHEFNFLSHFIHLVHLLRNVLFSWPERVRSYINP